VQWLPDGRAVTITLDTISSAQVNSRDEFLFGIFGAWIKLPAFDSAGTITTFYLTSDGPNHCEFDFEFLGNKTGEPFLVHTNVFVDGEGAREQEIFPDGFDPTADFHYYSFEWSADNVVWRIDHSAIREFRNLVNLVPDAKFCTDQPMRLIFSIWDGSNWATRGGRDPINWTDAPFNATYTDFYSDGCVASVLGVQACQSDSRAHRPALAAWEVDYMRYIRSNPALVHHNYCNRPIMPPECAYNAMSGNDYHYIHL
jgi:xyloglucan:xyloglucosyl transferase